MWQTQTKQTVFGTLAVSRDTSHSNLADSFSFTSTSCKGFVNSTWGAGKSHKTWLQHETNVKVWRPQGEKDHTCPRTCNLQETRCLEFLCITRVHLGIIRSTVANDKDSSASICNHFILLGLKDFVSVSVPANLCVVPGNFTFQTGHCLLFHCLIFQGLRELYRWLWTHRSHDQFHFLFPVLVMLCDCAIACLTSDNELSLSGEVFGCQFDLACFWEFHISDG